MAIDMYELSGTDACAARRAFRLKCEGGSKAHMKKSGAIKKAVKAVMKGSLTPEEATDEMVKDFSEIPYNNEKQRKIHVDDAMKQVMRYVSSEKRKPYRGGEREVDLGYDVTVRVKADFFFFDADGTIEGVILKTKMPDLSQKNAENDLGLYALLSYVKSYVKYGETRTVKASYYYLRRKNDSASKAVFDDDFFAKGGKNVVTLEEKDFTPLPKFPCLFDHEREDTCDDFGYSEGCPYAYICNPNNWMTDLDAHFAPIVKQYAEGLPKEECTKEDCRKCDLKEICHYSEPPIAKERTTVVKSVGDIRLTKEQTEAIEYENGILRINAGAGAGKTMVVALRTATLISKGVDPKKILLITFTNAGAEEMKARIQFMLDDFGCDVDVETDMKICTFNSFGNDIIAEEYDYFGYPQEPKLIDDVERSQIIKRLLSVTEIDGLDYRNFTTDMKNCKGALVMAKKVFDLVKSENFSTYEAAECYDALGANRRFISINAVEELITLYGEYDTLLREESLIEFSDQEILPLRLLADDPYYLEKFGYEHIIVDEFQDTNKNEMTIVRKLKEAPSFHSLMVVGDDSQAIYSFRNTSPEYIINFDAYIGDDIDDINLLENHRSTPEIIAFANKINTLNDFRIPKNLIAIRKSGAPVIAKGFFTKDEEYAYVIDGIKEHLSAGCKPEDIAVTAFTKREVEEIADLLTKEGIPSVLLVPQKLCENSRVSAAIALADYMRDRHNEKSLLTYANACASGSVMDMTEKEAKDLLCEVKEKADTCYILPDEDRKAKFIKLLEEIDPENDEVYRSFIDTISHKRWEKILEYTEDFIELGASCAYRPQHSYPGIQLTTAHSSKGLEWPVVYNMISKYHNPGLDVNGCRARERVEENRRLLFVSSTRAKDELIVTGRYDAYGKRGDYVYNRYLREALIVSGTGFSSKEIEDERLVRIKERKKKASQIKMQNTK